MRRVELRLKQRVTEGHEHDFGVLNGLYTTKVIKGGGYKKLYKKAQKLSQYVGMIRVPCEDEEPMWFFSSEKCCYGLAAVCLEVNVENKDGGCGVVCNYFDGGKHVDTRIEDKAYLIEKKKEHEFDTLKKILRKLQALQIKRMVYRISVSYEEDSVCAAIYKNKEDEKFFSFYSFENVDSYIETYNELVDYINT